jgi:hypothetical protein
VKRIDAGRVEARLMMCVIIFILFDACSAEAGLMIYAIVVILTDASSVEAGLMLTTIVVFDGPSSVETGLVIYTIVFVLFEYSSIGIQGVGAFGVGCTRSFVLVLVNVCFVFVARKIVIF